MVTLHLGHYDRDTEIAITASKSSLELGRAGRVVDLVRLCRCEGQDPHYPTLRASIAIARVMSSRGGDASLHNPVFVWACRDILSQTSADANNEGAVSPAFIDLLLRRFEYGEADDGASARLHAHADRHTASQSKGGK